MGEGPFGDSDASVEACRDRNLSEWGGRGLLEAKMFGLLQFFAFVGPRWSGEVCGGVKGSHVREIRGPCTPVLFGVKQHRLAKSKHLANSRRFSLVRRCVIVATRPDPAPLTISPPRGRSLANYSAIPASERFCVPRLCARRPPRPGVRHLAIPAPPRRPKRNHARTCSRLCCHRLPHAGRAIRPRAPGPGRP